MNGSIKRSLFGFAFVVAILLGGAGLWVVESRFAAEHAGCPLPVAMPLLASGQIGGHGSGDLFDKLGLEPGCH